MISDAQYQEWLKADNEQRVLLVEANYYDPVWPIGPGTLEETVNLYEYPEDLSSAAWIKTACTVEPNTVTFSNGINADKIVPTAVTSSHGVLQYQSCVISETYTLSLYAKAGEYSVIQIAPSTGFSPTYRNFDLIAGALGSGTAPGEIESLGGGVYRCSITLAATSTISTGRSIIGPVPLPTSSRANSFLGDDVSGIHVGGIQLEHKPYVTAYVNGSRAASGHEHTKCLASMPYISKPTDTPSNQPYDDSVVDVPKFTAALSDALDGYTVPSWGDVVIDNSLFDKDDWFNYAWDGRRVLLLLGSPKWSRSDFRSLLTGTIAAAPVANGNQIKLSIKDKQWELNKPIQTQLIGDPVLISGTTYSVSKLPIDSIDEVWDAGVLLSPSAYTTSPSTQPATFTLNAEPAGRLAVKFTGGATAVGDVVPLCYGEVFNITPKVLSTAFSDVDFFIYQIQGAPIYSVPQVRDSGIPVEFVADLQESDFTLVSSPVGVVTCNVLGSTSGGVFVETVGRIFRWIILNQTDMTFNDINYASLSAFIDKCPQRVGIYVNTRRNTLDVLDELMKSVGGFYTPDRNGKMIFGRIEPVIENPVLEITADDVVFGSLKPIKQSVPWQTVRIGYLKNYTVQDKLHGAVSDHERSYYSQEWRYAKKTDPRIKTAHTLALEPDAKNTCLVDYAEAYAEAERQLALHGVVRTTYSIEYIGLTTLNLGEVVRLTYNRYGLDNGKNLYIVGISESLITRKTILTLWG